MAGTDPYDRVTEGVSSGLKFALEQRKLDNEEASINERLEAARIAKTGNNVAILGKVSDTLKDISGYNPKLQAAASKALAPKIASVLGIPEEDGTDFLKSAMLDKTYAQSFQDMYQAIQSSYDPSTGRLRSADYENALQTFLNNAGTAEGMKIAQEAIKNINQTNQSFIKTGSAETLQGIRDAAALERAKIMAKAKEGSQARIEKKDIHTMFKDARTNFNSMTKKKIELEDNVFKRTESIFSKNPKLLNPTEKLNLVKIFQQGTEQTPNAVREGEITMSQELQTKFDTYMQRFGSITNQKEAAIITPEVAADMIAVAKEIRANNLKGIQDIVAQTEQEIQDFGLQKYEQSILGKYSKKQIKQKQVQQEQAKKSLPAMSDDNIRKNIVAAYRRNGITPTEAQIKAKIQLYKQKSGAK